MAKPKHECIRDCYYLNHLWKAGDIFEEHFLSEGNKPNKHFQLVGGDEEIDISDNIRQAGDDPRSTNMIISDLKDIYDVTIHPESTRKVAFGEWLKAKETKTAAPVQPSTDPQPGNVLILKKKFRDFTPDDVDAVTARQLAGKALKELKIDINIAGAKKLQIMKRCVDAEARLVGARTP